MKKSTLALLVLMVLVGCNHSNDELNQGNDNNKEFVDVEKTDEYILKDLVEGTIFVDFYNSSMESEDYQIPLDKARMFNNEKIVIDSESNDAKTINDRLDLRYQENRKLRQEAETRLNEESISFTWANQYLYDIYKTEDYISFSVYSSWFVVPGSGHNNLEIFTFETDTDSLLKDEAVLALHNLSLDDVKAYIIEDFEAEYVDHYGQSVMRHLVDEKPELEQWYDNDVYYRIKPEFAMTVTDSEVVIVLEMFLGLSDTFEAPTIYKIPLNEL